MPARKSSTPRSHDDRPFVHRLEILRDDIPKDRANTYPYSIPALAALTELALDNVTIFVGENGSGKSTLIEAIAIAAGFNAEGGSRNFAFATSTTHSQYADVVRLVRGSRRPSDGYFLRAESYYNVASEIDRLDAIPSAGERISDAYGGAPHERSHGESFIALVQNRFRGNGLYIFDEPEAALSPTGCLGLLRRMRELADGGSQLIYATHSPFLMAYPGATIYRLGNDGARKVTFEQLEHVNIMRDFLNDPDVFMRALLD